MKIFFKSFFCISLLTVGIAASAEQLTDSPYYRAGNLVYISGQVAINPSTGKISSDNLKDQVNQIFKNLKGTAEKAGGGMQDIVKLNVYMNDIDKAFPIVKAAIPKYFKKPYPARTPIGGVKIGDHMLLEIEAIMYLPENKKKK